MWICICIWTYTCMHYVIYTCIYYISRDTIYTTSYGSYYICNICMHVHIQKQPQKHPGWPPPHRPTWSLRTSMRGTCSSSSPSRAGRQGQHQSAQEPPWGVPTQRLPGLTHGSLREDVQQAASLVPLPDTAKQQGLRSAHRLSGPQNASKLRGQEVLKAGQQVLVRGHVSSHQALHALQSRSSGGCCGTSKCCHMQGLTSPSSSSWGAKAAG